MADAKQFLRALTETIFGVNGLSVPAGKRLETPEIEANIEQLRTANLYRQPAT